MSTKRYFPVDFMVINNNSSDQITNGIYLRWNVKPYLGIVGIHPLNETSIDSDMNKYGFRLFVNSRYNKIPDPELIPNEKIIKQLKKDSKTYPLIDRENWFGFNSLTDDVNVIDLSLGFLPEKCRYLCFNYRLRKGQDLKLEYTISKDYSGDIRNVSIDLDYDRLFHEKSSNENEYLSYAIHVDESNEYISRIRFSSNKAILVGDFYYVREHASAGFYKWTPPGGDAVWMEIPRDDYLIASMNSQRICPVDESAMIDSFRDFYRAYYDIAYDTKTSDEITFQYPDTGGLSLSEPIVRNYNKKFFNQLISGDLKIPDDSDVTSSMLNSQEIAIISSGDPAVAYIMGLFRIIKNLPVDKKRAVFKLQGQWPDGKRFCRYFEYSTKPALNLPASISDISAGCLDGNQVLKDYKTFRVHDKLKYADIAWKTSPAVIEGGKRSFKPLSYVILRLLTDTGRTRPIAEFYMPQTEDIDSDDKIHYEDYYDFYNSTDIKKTLDGKYRYYIAGIDYWGQITKFRDILLQIYPNKLEPGEVVLPEILLRESSLAGEESGSKRLEIPLIVEKTGSEYELREFINNDLLFRVTFFWPYESRYLWGDINSTNSTIALDYFRLYYLKDTPLYCTVIVRIISMSVDGIVVQLRGVRLNEGTTDYKNSALCDMLRKLHAASSSGAIYSTELERVLTGGSLFIGKNYTIKSVELETDGTLLKLTIMPAEKSSMEYILSMGYYYQHLILRLQDYDISGSLYWNQRARSDTGLLANWNQFFVCGEKIFPPDLIEVNDSFVSRHAGFAAVPFNDHAIEPTTGINVFKSESEENDAHYFVRVPHDNPLYEYDRFQLMPYPDNPGLLPGEYLRPANPETDIPSSLDKVFSENRIFTFTAKFTLNDPEAAESEESERIYRIDPLIITAEDTSVAPPKSEEFLIFPDPDYDKWCVNPPVKVDRKLESSEFVCDEGFDEKHNLKSSLTFGIEAVVKDADSEVTNSLQSAAAVKKLVFSRYIPPPTMEKSEIAPSFGIEAFPPGVDGESLISIRNIYRNHDLENLLLDDKEYFLYTITANRILQGCRTRLGIEAASENEMPVEYARFPVTADEGTTADDSNGEESIYKRNMVTLTDALNATEGSDVMGLGYKDVADVFKNFAQKVNVNPLAKSDFIDYPVTIPGESLAVFVYAIKAYDPVSKKESDEFYALSEPVYVEDITKPQKPRLTKSAIRIIEDSEGTKIIVDLCVSRKLHLLNGYGYATETDLNNAVTIDVGNEMNLLGYSFPNFVKSYWLYLCNDTDLCGTFLKITSIGESLVLGEFTEDDGLLPFSVRLEDSLIIPIIPESIENYIDIHVEVPIAFTEGKSIDNLPAKMFMCLRAENYLGQKSEQEYKPCNVSFT